MTYRGTVVRKTVDAGSKSEREAAVLASGGTEHVLRRRGGNPFEPDAELLGLAGREVEVEGVLDGTTIHFDACRVVP